MMDDERMKQAFEKAYPPPAYAIQANGEAGKAIHYSHLKREREGFEKGWRAATAAVRDDPGATLFGRNISDVLRIVYEHDERIEKSRALYGIAEARVKGESEPEVR